MLVQADECIEENGANTRSREMLVDQMARAEGVAERLKHDDQMAWIRAMNSIRHRAEEIVLDEIVYSLRR